MKKAFITAILIYIACPFVNGQNIDYLNGIGVKFGKTDLGVMYKIDYTKAINEKILIKPTLYIDRYSRKLANISNIGIDAKVQKYIASLGESFNLSAAGGAVINLISETNFGKELSKKVAFGLVAEAEVEYILSQEFRLILEFNQRYMINSPLGKTFYDISFGIKFNLFSN